MFTTKIVANVTTLAALYVVLKIDGYEIAYTASDYSGLISNNAGKIKITLPVINGQQQRLPYDGAWKISLCNNREQQRQSLSKALKPRANLESDI